MRILRLFGAAAIGAMLCSCSGAGSNSDGIAPNAVAPMNTTVSSQRQLAPEYQPTPAPNEELLVLVKTCNADPSLSCTNYTSTIMRYALSSGAPLSSIHLQTTTCGGGGADSMVASAGDQYFISDEYVGSGTNCQGQLEVDGVDGSVAYLNPKARGLLTSSDLSTVLATGYQTTTVYRAPFRSASRVSTLYGNGTNSNGSVVFEPGQNGQLSTLAIESLISGQTTTVSRNTGGVGPESAAFYDARHGFAYFLAGNGKVTRLMVVDAVHNTFVGYVNVPQSPGIPVLSIDPTSSDLYVLMGQTSSNVHTNVYVYNLAACGCLAPRRVLAMPFNTQYIAIDRNGQHLIAWYSTPQSTTYIEDLNPQTGAVQRSFPPISSAYPTYNTVYTVLAQ